MLGETGRVVIGWIVAGDLSNSGMSLGRRESYGGGERVVYREHMGWVGWWELGGESVM